MAFGTSCKATKQCPRSWYRRLNPGLSLLEALEHRERLRHAIQMAVTDREHVKDVAVFGNLHQQSFGRRQRLRVPLALQMLLNPENPGLDRCPASRIDCRIRSFPMKALNNSNHCISGAGPGADRWIRAEWNGHAAQRTAVAQYQSSPPPFRRRLPTGALPFLERSSGGFSFVHRGRQLAGCWLGLKPE